MPEPTFADVDALVGPATPHFAYQLRARVRELVLDLPDDDPVRQYADEKIELLDRPRPRVVEGRGGRPRAPRPAPAGTSSRAPRPPTRRSPRGNEPDGILGPRDRGNAGDRPGDRASARRATAPTRAVLGYMRNDTAAEAAAETVRAAGAEPVLVRGERRVAERRRGARRGRPVPRRRPQRRDRRDPAGARDRGQALGLDARTRTPGRCSRSRARPRRRWSRGSSIVAISSLGSQRVLDNYVARRHVEGGARVDRPLPRASSSARAGSASTPSPAASSTPSALEFFPNKDQMLARSSGRRPAGSSSPTTSPPPSPSSARPTPR